jgi:hypothetical protein
MYKITTPDEFEKLVNETARIASGLATALPQYLPVHNVYKQLEAIRQWTKTNHKVAADEKKSINLGLIAVREFDEHPNPQLRDLGERLIAISSYIDRVY